jgi:hypothetical protein
MFVFFKCLKLRVQIAGEKGVYLIFGIITYFLKKMKLGRARNSSGDDGAVQKNQAGGWYRR